MFEFAEQLWVRVLDVSPEDPEAIAGMHRLIPLIFAASSQMGSEPFESSIKSPDRSPAEATASSTPGADQLPLKLFSFEVITVNAQGQETQRRRQQARGWEEDLGNGITLTMLEVEGGTFTMGAPPNERGLPPTEGPRRFVRVNSFWMSRYVITQPQWRAVAMLPKVNHDLNADPSHKKGANRPVEGISWFEAVEFCARLSQKTGREYRLPSEAEWEYACRAGTTTPFHFGATITTDLANYKGGYIYAQEPRGIFRKEITEVGLFPPNAFGLCDMHGNMLEWCLDHWHENYKGAPTDGSAWLTDDEQANRVTRGGFWVASPHACRSAARFNTNPVNKGNDLGVRVVCVTSRTV